MTDEQSKLVNECITESMNNHLYYKNMEFERLAGSFERANKALILCRDEIIKLNKQVNELNLALAQFKSVAKEEEPKNADEK